MNISPYNPYDRYRKRSAQRFFGIFLLIGGMFGAAFVGYFVGRESGLRENLVLADQNKTLVAERDALQATINGLRTEVKTADLKLEDMQKTQAQQAPAGPQAELMEMINKEIAGGMEPERIAFLLRSNHPPRNCTDPVTQRFIVSTPAYKGAASQINIGNGAIVIKASGESAHSDKGAPEAWYDPGRAIVLEFTMKDGKTESKKGVMPINYTAVLDGRQYRFTVTEGARSFARVTYDSCDYP